MANVDMYDDVIIINVKSEDVIKNTVCVEIADRTSALLIININTCFIIPISSLQQELVLQIS